MKQLYIFVLFIYCSASFGQTITFSDPAFKNRLLQASTSNAIAKGVNGNNIKIDANNNQEIEVSEAQAVYRLGISSSQISAIPEISYFTNLRSLTCNNNSITNLDVSALVSLVNLRCDNNELTNLDVSMLGSLETLNCAENNLISLNVSGAVSLSSLLCEENELESLVIQASSNLTTLNCSQNSLNTLNIAASPNLLTLNCSQNNLSALSLTGFTALQTLNCSQNQLTSINLNSLVLLEVLDASENNLSNVNLSQLTALRNLDVHANQISQISFSTNLALESIKIYENALTSIDVSMLQELTLLYVTNNNLSSLTISGLTSLYDVAFASNQLQSVNLSNLPELAYLDLSQNQINALTLSNLPQLWMLYLGSNLLTSLDLTPFPLLIELICNNNQLNNLVISENTSLDYVDATYNQLTQLELPPFQGGAEFYFSHNNISTVNPLSTYDVDLSYNNLTNVVIENSITVDLSNNQISNLTVSEDSTLMDLNCSNNNLTILDIKSTALLQINANNNNLQAILIPNNGSFSIDFSNNNEIQYICVDPIMFYIIQMSLNQLGLNDVELNSYCDFNPGGTFYTISGNQRYNFNGSSCSTSDPIVPNLKFNITNGSVNGTMISDESGAYSIPVQAGQHTVTPVVPSSAYYSISPASFVANFPTQASPLVQNFCITANGTFPDIEVNLIPIGNARPGFDSFYKILVKNVGTTVQSGAVVFNYDESVSDFIEATPTSPTINPGSVSWTVSNLAPFSEQEFFVTLNHNSPMETPALNSDDLLSFSANMQTAATDSTPDNNVSTLSQVVVNSFDPNDKTCLAGPTIGPEQVGKFVNYMIRFENTGTAAAERVIITDRIDTSKFDISTLTPLDSSHPFTTRISNGNRVEFIFENIQLGFTDETNDGYVVFKIKTVPTLVVGDTFSNSAAIYFDFNYPIFTNDATTEVQVLGTENFDWQKSFAVFPNPMNAELTVKSLTDASVKKIEVFNTLGQLVISVVQP
ncbi:hypothetical protein, partial [Flavobacterium sp.]|uniref:leucine-rich repeat domain-containing protein n=1 Tax=Flavobacterium sp. TaxID=239 RepID=UPI00261558CE